MPTCAECIHAELQCPPVIRCDVTGEFRYLDSPASKHFKLFDEEESSESNGKK
jgi:hypothetical protein